MIEMKFDDFDRQMRIYEESLDQYILPDMYLVARLDGRSFTKLTKKICQFDAGSAQGIFWRECGEQLSCRYLA